MALTEEEEDFIIQYGGLDSALGPEDMEGFKRAAAEGDKWKREHPIKYWLWKRKQARSW
jgi:hypothetical protein